eukprot:5057790-Pyramimonas_sp.AAC.1
MTLFKSISKRSPAAIAQNAHHDDSTNWARYGSGENDLIDFPLKIRRHVGAGDRKRHAAATTPQ